jgi:hypothetical protein
MIKGFFVGIKRERFGGVLLTTAVIVSEIAKKYLFD